MTTNEELLSCRHKKYNPLHKGLKRAVFTMLIAFVTFSCCLSPLFSSAYTYTVMPNLEDYLYSEIQYAGFTNPAYTSESGLSAVHTIGVYEFATYYCNTLKNTSDGYSLGYSSRILVMVDAMNLPPASECKYNVYFKFAIGTYSQILTMPDKTNCYIYDSTGRRTSLHVKIEGNVAYVTGELQIYANSKTFGIEVYMYWGSAYDSNQNYSNSTCFHITSIEFSRATDNSDLLSSIDDLAGTVASGVLDIIAQGNAAIENMTGEVIDSIESSTDDITSSIEESAQDIIHGINGADGDGSIHNSNSNLADSSSELDSLEDNIIDYVNVDDVDFPDVSEGLVNLSLAFACVTTVFDSFVEAFGDSFITLWWSLIALGVFSVVVGLMIRILGKDG